MVVERRTGKLTLFCTINILAGIWMIIMPFALGAATGARWDDVIFGVLVIIFAAARLASPTANGLSWVNFAFGIWLLISPYVLGFAGSGVRWNNTITGIIVLIFAALAARERFVVSAAVEPGIDRRRAA